MRNRSKKVIRDQIKLLSALVFVAFTLVSTAGQAIAIAIPVVEYLGPEHSVVLEDGSIVTFYNAPIDFNEEQLIPYLPNGMNVLEDFFVQYKVMNDSIVLDEIMIMGAKLNSHGSDVWPTITKETKSKQILDVKLLKPVDEAVANYTDLLYRPMSPTRDSHLYIKVIDGVIVDRVDLDESQNKAFRDRLFERYKQTDEFAKRMEDLHQYNLSDEYYEKVIRIKTKHYNDVEVSFPIN